MIFKVIMYTRRVASRKARLGNHIKIFMKMQRTKKNQDYHVHTESCISESPWGPHHNFLGAVHKLCCLKIGNF